MSASGKTDRKKAASAADRLSVENRECSEEDVSVFARKARLAPVLGACVMALAFFLPAGTFDYWQGWALLVSFSLLTLFTGVYLSKVSPALLARRFDAKPDDIRRHPPVALNLFFLAFIMPGLDHRFGWSSVPLWLVLTALAVFILGYVLIILVFRENAYAAAAVQVECGQGVIATGPYAVVRHPMYGGIVLMVCAAPLALGSYWGLLPALLIIPLNVIRIMGEEATLRRDLPGYAEYCGKVRYRLLPRVW